MKKSILIITLTLISSLNAANNNKALLALKDNNALLSIGTENDLDQLKEQVFGVAQTNTCKKGLFVGGVTLLTQSPLAKELAPQLFPRGMVSNALTAVTITTLAGGGWWALNDYYRAWKFAGEAKDSMGQAIHEMQELKAEIEELKSKVNEQNFKTEEANNQIGVAKRHARLAKESMERTEESLKVLVAGIKGDWNNAVHKNDFDALKREVTDLNSLVQTMALESLRKEAKDQPTLEDLAKKADVLQEAGKRFTKIDDAHIAKYHGALEKRVQAEAKRKKKEKEPKKHSWLPWK